MMHRKRWIIVVAGAALVLNVNLFAAQDAGTSASSKSADSKAEQKPNKYSHANDFLIHGTVFDDRGLGLPGVELKIRRDGEKKHRWSTYTNRRGEFAIRVPQGAEYEVVAQVKGMAKQILAADGKGETDGNLAFHMEPSGGGKR
jgi:hypothetical protein